MNYNKINGKGKKIAIIAAVVILAFISALSVYYFIQQNSSKAPEAAVVKEVIPEKKVNVIRAKQAVNAGDIADITKFEIVELPENLAPKDAAASMSELSDKRVKTMLSEREVLLKSDLIPSSAWYEDGDRLTEHTFQPGAIPSAVSVGSVVDIKLFKDNSKDPVVVSKAVVISKVENTVSFYLNAQEQEYLKEGATEGLLFMVLYLDDLQESSKITYTPDYSSLVSAPAPASSSASGSGEASDFASAPDLN